MAEKVFGDIKKATQKAIKKVKAPSNLQKHADQLADDIRTRTRLGKGTFGENNPLQKMDKLSPKYIEKRKKSKLHATTSARKSNLTFTGQLLEAIRGSVKKAGQILVKLHPKRRGSGLDNRKLNEYLEDMNRPFFYASKVERKKLANAIEKDIDNQIDKELKKT